MSGLIGDVQPACGVYRKPACGVDAMRFVGGLSIDEKSQIQALDRTQPGLPMKKGRAGRDCRDFCVRRLSVMRARIAL